MNELAIVINVVLLLAAYAGGGLVLRVAVAALFLVACGSPWSSSPDGQRVSAALNLARYELADCHRDGGACTPGDMRQTADGICGALASVVRDHGGEAGCP